jgi:energy-coupling factor transporter ATP-binding protein EcfA2
LEIFFYKNKVKRRIMKIFYSTTLKTEAYSGIHLIQDNIGTRLSAPWNDYGFVVKFQVHYVKNSVIHKLGFIRLLINGYENTSLFFEENGVAQEDHKIIDITGTFNSKTAVSLPLEIDYYHKLCALFTEANVKKFLRLVCDGSYNYHKYENFKDWDGFSGSIMREGTVSEAIIQKGMRIAIGTYLSEDSFEITLQPQGAIVDPLTFGFDTRKIIGEKNINILAGKNGVGKTHALKRITEIVTGIESAEEKWPYFHKLIVVAYSPFENFYTVDSLLDKMDEKYRKDNGLKINRKNRVRRRLNVNEYAYVGFRDEDGNFNVNLPRNHSVESLAKIIKFDRDNDWWDVKSRFSILMDTLLLCINFDYIAIEVEVKGEAELLLLNDTNIHKVNRKQLESLNLKGGLRFIKNDQFIELSSGQKIYSYMIPAIVAELETESLIIIDEPELYLHPSLEVGLMNMLKLLLSRMKSYAIIATHSAIITREVDRSAVSILRTASENTTVSLPNLQTYGASLESIIGEVFDDYLTIKPFQDEIDAAINDKKNILELISTAKHEIGSDALAYMLSQLDDEIVVEAE